LVEVRWEMPEFLNPFSGLVPRKMTQSELIRALRLNVAAELEAVHLYVAHAEATEDPLAKRVLLDIANEERQHAGEFMEVIRRLAPDEQHFLDVGRGEVEAMAAELSAEGSAEPVDASLGITIGSLRNGAGEER
jgi:rubrerythrin